MAHEDHNGLKLAAELFDSPRVCPALVSLVYLYLHATTNPPFSQRTVTARAS